MTSSKNLHVVFFQVQDAQTKVRRLVETAHFHFGKKEHFMIFVEDDKALQYVDELLWKFPETSFLPHSVADGPTSDWVVISKDKKNLNGARFAFNLCPTPLLIEPSFQILYDFEDVTSSAKKNFSSLRFDAYKKANYLIEAR